MGAAGADGGLPTHTLHRRPLHADHTPLTKEFSVCLWLGLEPGLAFFENYFNGGYDDPKSGQNPSRP